MRLFVGLGNPGPEYARTRHNLGFIVVNAIAKRHGFQQWRPRSRFDGMTTEGSLRGEQVILLKPLTFMNASGYAVQSLLTFYKMKISDLSVFHDEIELPPAVFRVKIGGGDAGHNGLRSISESIGPNYRRVRIGIGRPVHKSQVESYVLGDFESEDLNWLEPMVGAIADNVGMLATNQDAMFQNRVHMVLQDAGLGSRGNRRPPSSEV